MKVTKITEFDQYHYLNSRHYGKVEKLKVRLLHEDIYYHETIDDKGKVTVDFFNKSELIPYTKS